MAPSLPAAASGQEAFVASAWGATLPPWSAAHAYTNLYGPKAAEKSGKASCTTGKDGVKRCTVETAAPSE